MKSIDYNKQIPVIKETDVLVVGGGPAGIAAAISAARNGSKTILVEQHGYLGGMATAGLVGPFMTSYSPDGSQQVIKGIFEEMVRRMEEMGGARHPEQVRAGTSYTSYITRGHDHVTPFDSEIMKVVTEEMCLEAGVEILYHNFFVDLILDEDSSSITGGVFAAKDGLGLIKSKVFIDCTGDADVAHRAGAEIKQGRDEDGLTQPTTLFFRIKNVDKEKIEEYRRNNPEPDSLQFSTLIEQAKEKGEFPIRREKIGMYESSTPGEWRVNTTRIHDIDATRSEDLTRAEIEGRKQVQIVLNFMRKYMPGMENVELVESASYLGVRETRRIVGEYILTEEDLLSSRRFEDTIALGGFAIDIHQPDGKSGSFLTIDNGKAYSIPYRSLLPKKIDNLLAAGRNISATHEALGAVRVMPPCFAMGEAAGAAAAIAVKEEMKPREIDVQALREILREQGAVVD